MKWIILLILFLILIAYIVIRFRRQINFGIEMYKMMRQFRDQTKPEKKPLEKTGKSKGDSMLVRCSRCGKWIPQDRAVNLRAGNFYCSTVCLEKEVV